MKVMLMLLHLPSHGDQGGHGGLALGSQRGCCGGQPAPVQVLLQSLLKNCYHRQRHDKEPSMSIFVPILVLMLLIYVVRMLPTIASVTAGLLFHFKSIIIVIIRAAASTTERNTPLPPLPPQWHQNIDTKASSNMNIMIAKIINMMMIATTT